MKTLTKRTKLMRNYHRLLRLQPEPAIAKEYILVSYNVTSSSLLSDGQLEEACQRLDKRITPSNEMMNKWRKRLIASIGGWLRAMNKAESIDLIKGIACRAAKRKRFNDIPPEQLTSLYNAFLNKAKDINSVDDLTEVEMDYLSLQN